MNTPTGRISLVLGLLFAGSVQAQERPEPVPPPPAAPAPTPKQKPLLSVTAHGKVKPTLIVGNGLESYNRPNASAPTAAVNPVLSARPGEVGASFQAQQTRFGIGAKAGTVEAKIEVDFVDFNQSSPTTTVRPRLRIAQVSWKATDTTTLEAGQGWDLISPLNPHSFNLVGAYFTSGNAAFMRHQFRVKQQVGTVEVAAALGATAPNATTSWSNVEFEDLPVMEVRLQHEIPKRLKWGFSAIATDLEFAEGQTALAYLASLHVQFTPKLGAMDLRAEGYVSQNSANLGTLTMSQGYLGPNGVVSLRDAGGYVSVRFYPIEDLSLYSTVGFAAVLNPDDVPPGVTRDENGNARRTSQGLRNNLQARVGTTWCLNDFALLYGEPYLFRTTHELTPEDRATAKETRLAGGLEVGALFYF